MTTYMVEITFSFDNGLEKVSTETYKGSSLKSVSTEISNRIHYWFTTPNETEKYGTLLFDSSHLIACSYQFKYDDGSNYIFI